MKFLFFFTKLYVCFNIIFKELFVVLVNKAITIVPVYSQSFYHTIIVLLFTISHNDIHRLPAQSGHIPATAGQHMYTFNRNFLLSGLASNCLRKGSWDLLRFACLLPAYHMVFLSHIEQRIITLWLIPLLVICDKKFKVSHTTL